MNTTPLKHFYVFGDSICFGQMVTPHLTWGTRLSAALNSIPGQRHRVLVQNVSINGNTTRQALERMGYDVTSHPCDFLMVQFGMNDCNHWATDHGVPRVSRKAFAANLEEIVERALANQTREIFLDTNHPSLKGAFSHVPGRTHAQSNAEYNEIIRSVHSDLSRRSFPVTLIDIEKSWKELLAREPKVALKDLLLPDGIHLSEKGHEIYGRIAVPAIARKIEAHLQ